MNGFYFYPLYRQDLQDCLDILNFRFPGETGNVKSASRKGQSPISKAQLICTISEQAEATGILSMILLNFHREVDAIFTVSSGNRENYPVHPVNPVKKKY